MRIPARVRQRPSPPQTLTRNPQSEFRNQIVSALRLRVTGDLADPEIDQSDLSEMSSRVLGNAATTLLQQEAARGLFRLLRPRDDDKRDPNPESTADDNDSRDNE